MRTTILPTDPNKRKAWAAKVAQDSAKDQYFSRMEGEEGTNSAVIRKTDLEAGAGDEVTTALVAKLRGAPIIEGQKLEGKEFRLQHAAHTMRINEFRHGVNVGARIEQSRVGYNLKKQGREKLTDYIAELYEEVITTAAAGTRGVGAEVQQLPLGWAGYPNAYRAPDAAHYFAGDGSVTAVGNITGTMKANLALLETLPLMAKKMLGGQPDKASKMQQIVKGGKKVWLFAAAPEVIKDIRADSGNAGLVGSAARADHGDRQRGRPVPRRRGPVQRRAGRRDGDLREAGRRRQRRREHHARPVHGRERSRHRARHQGHRRRHDRRAVRGHRRPRARLGARLRNHLRSRQAAVQQHGLRARVRGPAVLAGAWRLAVSPDLIH
jgi:N4-gp56 family major capsid protein